MKILYDVVIEGKMAEVVQKQSADNLPAIIVIAVSVVVIVVCTAIIIKRRKDK